MDSQDKKSLHDRANTESFGTGENNIKELRLCVNGFKYMGSSAFYASFMLMKWNGHRPSNNFKTVAFETQDLLL